MVLLSLLPDSKNLCDISDKQGILGFDYREGVAVKEESFIRCVIGRGLLGVP